MNHWPGEVSRVWDALQRRENELKSAGRLDAVGPPFYGGMGRRADAAFQNYGRWAREQAGRVSRVREALAESGPLARRMLVAQFAGIDLTAVWDILISTCKDIALVYGGSVIAGGAIGGIGGAFIGGVGAVPGASAGAAAGGYAGGWVLALLGLKSLVEGVVEAIPEALNHYERGILEAWGPTRHDPYFGGTSGSVGFAAGDLAKGHVVMISAILSVLVTYLTRGRGDRGMLLKEVSESPRLGPTMAAWLEQNADRLRNHPALQSRGSGASGSGVSRPRAAENEQPPQLKRRREPVKEPERPRSYVMPQKVVPCFKTNGLPPDRVPEFDRQLAGQEAGINNMTVREYIEGRKAFGSKEALRDPKVASRAREVYADVLEKAIYEQLRDQGMSRADAKVESAKAAAEKMKTLAALHNPDMVVGGKDVISDFGCCNVNSRIGAQWKKGQRLAELDEAAKSVPAGMRGETRMNAKLERCK